MSVSGGWGAGITATRVYEGTRPVANFREAEDAALAVRLHNDHVRAESETRDRKPADPNQG